MEMSSLMWAVAHDQTLQQRIEAIVRDARWAGNEDPTAPVPAPELAWAVATDHDISTGVQDRLDPDAPNAVATACAGITDADLTSLVTTATARLQGEA